jgi:excisionase family DNA binding protein
VGIFAVQMPDANYQAYLTVEDVAKRFGVDVSTVYRLVKRGKLPAFKVGSQWRFSEARLEEWAADRERIG